MLILPQLVKVKIASRNKKHYVDLGYNVKKGDTIITDVTKLTKGSHVITKCLCDNCGCIIERQYKEYLHNHDYENNKDYCNKCKIIKSRNTSFKKYGVDNPMKSDIVKENLKKSLTEKYGTYKISSLPEVREKIKQTNLKKYGVENPMQSDEIREKAKNTCVKKYGLESSLQLPVTREKMKEYMKLHFDEMAEKRKNTNLNKYGCVNPFENEIVKEKIKSTILDKYGVEYASQSDEIKEKVKNTVMERYGVKSSLQLPKTREKMNEYFNAHKDEIIQKRMTTLKKFNGIPTSSQQIAIYEILKEQYENVELNYVFNRFSLDIALFLYDKKIDIEYDGWYWHQDKEKDRRRDEIVKSQDWCVLRIKSGIKLPTMEQMVEKINLIIQNNVKYAEIILDDWKEAV